MRGFHPPRKGSKLRREQSRYWDTLLPFSKTRAKMIDFICSVGEGGYAGRHGRYAISFNVRLYDTQMDDAEKLWRIVADDMDHAYLINMPMTTQVKLKERFLKAHKENEEYLFEWATGDVWRNFKDSMRDTFTGEVLPSFEVLLLGRGGGHLVINDFCGINVNQSPDGLREDLEEVDDGAYLIRDDEVRSLFLACVQFSVALDRETLCKEADFQAAFALWYNLTDRSDI